jgi:alpha-mannosidase
LWALKPAEEGPDQGLIARLWNLNPAAVEAQVTINPVALTGVTQTSHIETPLQTVDVVDNGIKARFTAQQLQTFLLHLATD